MYCMTGRWPQGPPPADGEQHTWVQAVARGLRKLGSRRGPGAGHQADGGERPGANGTGGDRAGDGRTAATQSGATEAAATATGATETAGADTWASGWTAAGVFAAGAAGGPAQRPPEASVSRVLRQVAAWSWCLLLTGLIVYLSFRLAVQLRLVVLPFVAAMLLTALLQPSVAWLKRRGMLPLPATWLLFLAALIVIAGAVTLFANRLSADFPSLYSQVQRTAREVQHSLSGPPFHVNAARLQNITNTVERYLSQHKGQVAGTVLTGGKYAIEFLAGLVLTLFISFFLLKDGARIWAWLISGLSPRAHLRVARAGDNAWQALVNWIRGTTLVAAIHALFIGIAMWLLGTPLLVPFIVLVFLAAFLPLVGILVVGALAILVALATKGWVAAVVLLIVFVVENQIESHLLQPLVVGRIVKLHPLAIISVLAVGCIIAGIPGAIVAVPFAAVISYAWPALRGDEPEE
jgi:predicted PurR-regulated permease PerM